MHWQFCAKLAIVFCVFGSSSVQACEPAGQYNQPLDEKMIDARASTTASTKPTERKPWERTRIYHGKHVKKGRSAWQVSIQKTAVSSSKGMRAGHSCGGSRIGTMWVLTAAHCVAKYAAPTVNGGPDWVQLDKTNLSVFMGGIILPADSSKPLEKGTDWIKVRQVFVHKKFRYGTRQNDIALIELKRAPKRTVKRKIIRLATDKLAARYEKPQIKARITGWGSTEKLAKSPQLLEADIEIMSDKQCRKNYESEGEPEIVDTMICAGSKARKDGKNPDACQGDSGGPLVISTLGPPRQVGIVSWGAGCAKPGLWGIYTRVSKYIPWIDQKLASVE